MRRLTLPLLITLAFAGAAPASAQSLARRVAAAGDGTVRFNFPTAPDVCGYDESIIRFHDDDERGFSMTNFRGSNHSWRGRTAEQVRAECRFGPAFVTVDLDDGRADRLRVRVGEPGSTRGTDLGAVSASEAVDYLLGTAATEIEGRGNDAIFAATLTDVDWAPAMLQLARDRDVRSSVRKDAIFWVSQAAGEKATRGLQSILGDESEEIEVRKQAVFALSQQRGEDAVAVLIDVAENSREPEVRKAAFFWLGQRDEDPRVIALFEKILLR